MKLLTPKIDQLQSYLSSINWLLKEEKIINFEKPGEGNMNFTLRVITNKRSFIVKQSRNFVEKYPQILAPENRVLKEAKFYKLIEQNKDLKEKMPALLKVDKTNKIMIIEDLGENSDFTFLYEKNAQLTEKDLSTLITYITLLHTNITSKNTSLKIINRKMRALNYEHIFEYPYINHNGFNLDEILPGLSKEAQRFKENKKLQNNVKTIGKHFYLKDGPNLIHGDYYPGSWLNTDSGIKIIDPEFCFFGYPEFELGVLIAHLKLAQQPQFLINKSLELYDNKNKIDKELVQKFAAIEVIRRIIGLAQLPLDLNLNERKFLLQHAQEVLS